jgi:hypothetical protein
MRTRAVLVALVTVLAVVAIIWAIAAGGSDGSRASDGSGELPAVEGRRPPTDYRIVYRVTTPDSLAEEEHVVHRPLLAHIVNRDADGNVTAERWSDLGRLVTRSQGADAVRIDTAVATSASDLRPDRFADALVEAKKAGRKDGSERVGGRACRTLTQTDEVPNTAGESLPVTIDRCIDAIGLVLQERWTTQAGDVVLTKRARVLELGDDVPDIDIPDAAPLADEQGNGAVRKIDDDEPPPFREAFALDVPDDFTFVGRYAVAPARFGTGVSGEVIPATDVALYTDVWRRGPDLLLLDQGATRGEAAPFDPNIRVGTVDLGPLGQAELAVDLRTSEVRLTRPDSGFVRVSGTIPLDELLTLALSLHVLQEAP